MADFWQQQWNTLVNNTVPALLFLGIGASAAWWLRGTSMQGEANALKAEIEAAKEQNGVLRERLNLAADESKKADKAREELIAALEEHQKRVEAKASPAVIEDSRETVEANLDALKTLAGGVRSLLGY